MTRVLVCGGRDFVDRDMLFRTLDTETPRTEPDAYGNDMPLNVTIIHGDCPTGADLFADDWAAVNWCSVEGYPADWQMHGRAAGPIRNQRMLDEGKPDLVIAFPGGRGTADMVRRAMRAGVKILEVRATPTQSTESGQ
jgi:hypothetical protein